MSTFGYLYVFEYTYPAILEIELTEEDNNLEYCDILEKHGYKMDNCICMCSENKLDITEIKE